MNKNPSKKGRTKIIAPDPYLGRTLLYSLDLLIPAYMTINTQIAQWTHGRDLSPLQKAACQIIPSGISIALSIREMIRSGYLLSAEILTRPLMERVAVISYLSKNQETAMPLWEKGWPHKSRPSLRKMLTSISEFDKFSEHMKMDQGVMLQMANELVDRCNSVVHGDPEGHLRNLGKTKSGTVGYLSGANHNDPKKCDYICTDVIAFMSILISRSAEIFPEAILAPK